MVQSVKDYLNGQQTTAQPSRGIQSVKDYLADPKVQANYAQEQSRKAASIGGLAKNTITGLPKASVTVGKALGRAGTTIVKETASPFIETGVKIGQAADSLLGNTPKDVNLWGREIKANETLKETVGRAARTVAFGLGPVAGGATFMGGEALSQNESLLPSKEHPIANVTTKSILGGVGGKVLDYGLGALGKLAQKSVKAPAPIKVQTVEEFLQRGTPEVPKVTPKPEIYEPYTPPDKLPVIQMGNTPKPKETLPTIQMGEKLSAKTPVGELTYEPIVTKAPISEMTTVTPRKVQTVQEYLAKPKTVVEPISSGVPETVAPVQVEGVGMTKTRGLSQGVEAKAVEKKLTEGFGDLPEYQSVSMKDQATKASEILTKDAEQAKRIALGEEVAPEGVLPESVFVAVEQKAINDGDIATLRALASNSRLSAEATTMGQRIRTLAERNPESPVGAIREVIKSREASVAKRYGNVEQAKKTVVTEIKAAIAKVSPRTQSWEQFIDSIQC